MFNLKGVHHIHIIGIGGVGNSAIAELLLAGGYSVSGSDTHPSEVTQHLESLGVTVYGGHGAENISKADLIVYTAAISDDNPELTAAREADIPCLSRAEMLGEIMTAYSSSIAVAGTHGKTTATSMLTHIFNDARFDPTALIGGHLEDIGSNVRIGQSELFVAEACEYKDSFLALAPKIGIILNVDEDHLDYFSNLEQIVSSFVAFSNRVHPDGALVLNGDDYNARKIIPYYKGTLITFGLSDTCTYRAQNITYSDIGTPRFDIVKGDTLLGTVSLQIPGQHNIYNALAAFAAAMEITQDAPYILSRLERFKNAKRRFEWLGHVNGITLIDDYAHHPNEIRATISAAARIESMKRIICIFQPHTYSRTKELLNEFAHAFEHADIVLLCDIYASREIDYGEVSAEDLLKAMAEEKHAAYYLGDFDRVERYISENARSGDLILTMGAGDITTIGPRLISALKAQAH